MRSRGGDLGGVRIGPLAPDQPPDAGEVEEPDPEAVEQAVIRDAGEPGPVDHVVVDHGEPLAHHQRRHEPVQGVEVGQPEIHGAAKDLEAAAGIPGGVLQDAPPHAVGDARLQHLEAPVLAAAPLALGEPGPFAGRLQGGQQGRDEGRVVLAVAVERRDGRGRAPSARRCAPPPTGRRCARAAPPAARVGRPWPPPGRPRCRPWSRRPRRSARRRGPRRRPRSRRPGARCCRPRCGPARRR